MLFMHAFASPRPMRPALDPRARRNKFHPPSSLNQSLKLTVSASYGPGGNTVSLIASHATPTNILSLGYSYTNTYINISLPVDTSQAAIYQRIPALDPTWCS
jgi:hypothetical protein